MTMFKGNLNSNIVSILDFGIKQEEMSKVNAI